MKLTFKNLFWVILLLSKFGVSSAQCPTTGLPTTTVKGSFEINFNNVKATTTGVNNTKVTVCPNSNFTVTDKSGLTGILYYYNTSRTAFPAPTVGYAAGNPRIIPTTASGQFIVIQVSYDAATRSVKSYACQAIEVKVPQATPKFTLSSCANLQGQLDIPTDPNNTFDSYLINWGDGSAAETVLKAQIPLVAKKHTYTNANNKTITITGKKASETCDATVTSSLLPNGKSSFTPNLFSLTVQDADTIQVRYVVGNNNTFDFYQKTGTSTYQNVKKVVNPAAGLNIAKVPVKEANKTQYCYKIGVTDACARTSYSDSSCTIPLQVTILNKRNFLKWKTLPATRFISYRITKNGNTNFKNITKATTDTLTDRPTVCGTAYSYQVIATSGNVQSYSQTLNVTGVDSTKPPVITNILASVEKEKVSITATIPTSQKLKSYTFYRWKNNKLESFNAGGNGSRVVDDKSDPNNQRECYKVAYENGCGIMSDTSAAFCPSFLTLDGSAIKWTDYQKFPLGLNAYYVEKLDDKGAVLTTTKVDKNLKFEPDPSIIDPANPIVKFRVKAESTNKLISYSNEVLYAQKLLMFLPDSFTPNGDNINEVFEIKGIFIKEFKIRIYNRSGNVIFESEDYKKGWDGSYEGSPVPEGQYYYEINATDFKGELTKANGRIVVVR